MKHFFLFLATSLFCVFAGCSSSSDNTSNKYPMDQDTFQTVIMALNTNETIGDTNINLRPYQNDLEEILKTYPVEKQEEIEEFAETYVNYLNISLDDFIYSLENDTHYISQENKKLKTKLLSYSLSSEVKASFKQAASQQKPILDGPYSQRQQALSFLKKNKKMQKDTFQKKLNLYFN